MQAVVVRAARPREHRKLPAMSILLYELVGRDDRRFSPYCWRTRMALAHKGLEVEQVPVKFTDKDKIAFSDQKLVPILVDGQRNVADSWAIACHLEDAYPARPSLFGGPVGRAVTRALNHWVDRMVHPALIRPIIGDLFAVIHPDDRRYFRETREARFGATIESLHATRAEHVDAARRALEPARLTLAEQPNLSGKTPAYGDYILFGSLQWLRLTSPLPIIAPDDPIHGWRERLLDLFDGYARAAPAAA
jgi:glutathione S-transferase